LQDHFLKILWISIQHLGFIRLDHDIVFNSYPAKTGDVDSRFDSKDHSLLHQVLIIGVYRGRLVDAEPQAVTGSVNEIFAIAGVDNNLTGSPIDFSQGDARPYGGDVRLIGLEHNPVYLFQPVRGTAHKKGSGAVGPVSGPADTEIDQHRIAFLDDEPVGFILTVPDWNPVLGDLEGSIWRHPIKLIRHLLLTKAEALEGIRLILLGIKSGYRNRGIESLLFANGIEVALGAGYEWCEYSWILEDNERTKGAVRLMGGELYKNYRVYEKKLG